MNRDELTLAKIKLIRKYYQTLENFNYIRLEDFLADYCQQLLAERLLHLITQAAVDINHHILSKLNPENHNNNFESFTELTKYKVITPELAKQLAPSEGLIKHLVYEYDDINPNKVFRAINLVLRQYPLYVRQINSYLSSLSEEDG
ncbi:type VII toxin-antitoxin system HepT family RNase toxin [Nostoc sp. FACHB-190]|uniref:type VII toxin-antitoxin system HepT family RNase toxin n=1 Tax=Nostoc sp. FACHB-190 TaxID=2692838 RepID=UPI001687AAD8|nr:DUF86 domain-containing protein [Nostoc sp. FACHB-190]MBD2303630.1 DUF86 domain-containing protein [Nostoc sp. FACHB-190]